MTCLHRRIGAGPDIPRVYGSWASEVCYDCGAWRTTTHRVRMLNGLLGPEYHTSEWHPQDELDAALKQDDGR